MLENDKASPAGVKQSDGMAMFGPYVVAFIDFLGQSSAIAKWDFVPATHELGESWLSEVTKSMGHVLRWRQEFTQTFDVFTTTLRAEAHTQPERVDVLDKPEDASPIQFSHFSDSIIIYSRLIAANERPQADNTVGIITACGMLKLLALTRQTVLRGGVEIGMLGHFPTGEPYGPALAKAYKLESKAADYPRIVVGPQLVSHLDALLQLSGQSSLTSVERVAVDLCRRCISQDTDGCWIVDYLNDTFAHAGGDPTAWRNLQVDAYAFVQAELQRFEQESNQNLTQRYKRLATYFRSRGST